MESEASGQINASDLVSEDQQAKRRERFLTPEQKEAETAKEEEAKRKQKRHSRFNLDDGKKADRTQRFQQWLAPGSTAAAPAAAAAANGKSAGDKITAAVNSSLDQSAKLLGKGPKGRSGSGKAAAAAPAEPKYTDEFKAKADVSSLLSVCSAHVYSSVNISYVQRLEDQRRADRQ